ncbi:uncharacterized protein LACBIDRAFT_330860 [Laccaria bicolor S238N-H82]|uniref:Predicted protein n=1 Tax=Laccaria bicolor (strain S238N-H82 / ATCC MYA-4686) TaxID=486041 RepID=B0DMZ8_LACBS|nr:uncharacterized protein LACBIDRAFT_330860 [Laccaria bicolor S238N-H82]EDR04061.1 predicted protein [Laccaria bicolor S238N-H82]|eukprot:XP_001885316.1 predicted protein [Laccaria bicolor S238N-H82]
MNMSLFLLSRKHGMDVAAYTLPSPTTPRQAYCTTVNQLFICTCPRKPTFSIIINPRSVTFAPFGVYFSGRGRKECDWAHSICQYLQTNLSFELQNNIFASNWFLMLYDLWGLMLLHNTCKQL